MNVTDNFVFGRTGLTELQACQSEGVAPEIETCSSCGLSGHGFARFRVFTSKLK